MTTLALPTTTTFASDFDDECTVYISNLLQQCPVTLEQMSDIFMEFFASCNIPIKTEVSLENPSITMTKSITDWLNAVDVTDGVSPQLIFP